MIEIGLNAYILLSVVLFAIGFFGVLVRKNTLVIYICLELMLVAATLALVAFIVALFRKRMTVQVDKLNALKN